jgi:hypothetical protein
VGDLYSIILETDMKSPRRDIISSASENGVVAGCC